MTVEEKARAYDEAMNKIKPLYEQAKRDGNPIWSTYEYLFPQLYESEDERIRKSIVATIEQCPDDFLNPKNRDRMLAWLEKQKEQKPKRERNKPKESWLEKSKYELAHEEELLIKRQKELSEIRALKEKEQKPLKVGENAYFDPDTDMWFIKKEQKPAKWNTNDKAFIKDCARILDENGYAASAERLLLMFPVKSAEWSEEDEAMMNNILRVLSCFIGSVECESASYLSTSYPLYRREMDWLKSLRGKFKENGKPSES